MEDLDLADLRASTSRMRLRAAKRLRREPRAGAEVALREALDREVTRNPRGWRTQYELVMALATHGDRGAVPALQALLPQPLQPMVHVAVAHALVLLAQDPAGELMRLVDTGDEYLQHGALRAAAERQLTLDERQANEVVRQVPVPDGTDVDDFRLLYIVIAAAAWSGPARDALLERASASDWSTARAAADAARTGEPVDVPIL